MGKFYETGAAAGMNHAKSKMFWKSEPWAVNHTPGQNKQSQAKLCMGSFRHSITKNIRHNKASP